MIESHGKFGLRVILRIISSLVNLIKFIIKGSRVFIVWSDSVVDLFLKVSDVFEALNVFCFLYDQGEDNI